MQGNMLKYSEKRGILITRYLDMENKRIVIKVGTSTLTHENGKINIRQIEHLVRVISDLHNRGNEIVLVSSGAVGAGVGKIGLSGRPDEVQYKQALAAIGQASLVSIYDRFFSEYGYNAAQVLLNRYAFEDEKNYRNTKNAFMAMFEYGVIPIVNENDVVSTEELEFGDNDTLSAYVSVLVEADLLIIMSDIDGFYDSNPSQNENAKVIPVITDINEEVLSAAGGAGTRRGTGGMKTKLNAAEIVLKDGIDMIITNGKDINNLYRISDGEQVGTLFKA